MWNFDGTWGSVPRILVLPKGNSTLSVSLTSCYLAL